MVVLYFCEKKEAACTPTPPGSVVDFSTLIKILCLLLNTRANFMLTEWWLHA